MKTASGKKSEAKATIALVGDEQQKKDRTLKDIFVRAGESADEITWVERIGESGGAELGRLLADFGSRPLFGGAKVIVVRDGDGLIKRTGQGLVKVLEIASDNTLVLFIRKLDGRTSFAKKLKTRGTVVSCLRPRETADPGAIPAGGELVREVVLEANRHGLQISGQVAAELAGRTGNDLLLVSSELNKLATFLGGGKVIAMEDVDAVVPKSATWDQFQLFREIAEGRGSAALRRLRGMMTQGTLDRNGRRTIDPRSISIGLLATLHNRIRLLARFRALSKEGLAGSDLQKALGVRNPGQMHYLGREATLPIVLVADEAVEGLAEADRALKTSQPAALVMERLVVRLSRASRKATSGSHRGVAAR